MLSIALVGSLVAAPALEVVLLPVVLGAGPEELRAVHDGVLASIETRANLRALSEEEVFVIGREALTQRARDCGPDAACLADALAGLRAELGLVVVYNALASPPLLDVRVIGVAERRRLADAPGPTRDEALADAVRTRVDRALTESGHPPSGHLVVRVEPPNARVSVDGAAPLADDADGLLLRAGHYRVSARADDYLPTTREVDVEAGRRHVTALTLEAQPGVLASPWFWGGVGVAAIAAGVAITVVATRRDCICVGATCPTCP